MYINQATPPRSFRWDGRREPHQPTRQEIKDRAIEFFNAGMTETDLVTLHGAINFAMACINAYALQDKDDGK